LGRIASQAVAIALAESAHNRDPEQFPDPDVLDLQRKNAGAHMAFSQGEHHCVGAPLARLELATAFEVLLDRFDHFELVPGATPRHLPGIALRTLAELPIRYSTRRNDP
jgi:cytochrome P450